MTAIKPPGGPGGVNAPVTADPTSQAGRADGPAFAERAEAPHAASGAEPPRDVSSVLADLRAGRVAPHDAVEQLVSLTLDKGGTPPALRPAVEAHIRAMLAKDPVVGELLRQMGVATPREE